MYIDNAQRSYDKQYKTETLDVLKNHISFFFMVRKRRDMKKIYFPVSVLMQVGGEEEGEEEQEQEEDGDDDEGERRTKR